jgi:NADH:ubiquinone oxidoreductase subunit D
MMDGTISSNNYSFIKINIGIMEHLIQSFYQSLYSFSWINASTISIIQLIESSKGIYSLMLNVLLNNELTINIITNDALSIQCLNKFCRNINLADLIAILGSIDFVLGSIDLIHRL